MCVCTLSYRNLGFKTGLKTRATNHFHKPTRRGTREKTSDPQCVCVCLKGGTSSSCGSTRPCRLWPSTCPVVFSSLSCSNVSLFWSIDLATDSSLPSDELCCLSCQPQMQNAQQTCTPPIRLSRTDRGGGGPLSFFFGDLFFLYFLFCGTQILATVGHNR